MDFTETNTCDSGNGNIRWAIDQANNRIGLDPTRFNPGIAGQTLQLESNSLA